MCPKGKKPNRAAQEDYDPDHTFDAQVSKLRCYGKCPDKIPQIDLLDVHMSFSNDPSQGVKAAFVRRQIKGQIWRRAALNRKLTRSSRSGFPTEKEILSVALARV